MQYPGLQGGGALGDALTPGTPAGSMATSAHGGTYSHNKGNARVGSNPWGTLTESNPSSTFSIGHEITLQRTIEPLYSGTCGTLQDRPRAVARMTRRRHVRRRRVPAVLRVRHPPIPPLPAGARLFCSTHTLSTGVHTEWLLCDRIPPTGCRRSRPVRLSSGRQAAFFFAALLRLWGSCVALGRGAVGFRRRKS